MQQNAYRVRRYVAIAVGFLFFVAAISSVKQPKASAYALLNCKQRFYSPGVIDFQWGNGTSTSTIWRNAHLSAAYAWDDAQNRVAWGNVPTSANVFQFYYSADPNEFGRMQAKCVNGFFAYAWAELNQYSLANQSFAFMTSTASHEQGHALGLAHSSAIPAIMNTARDRERVSVPQPDDVAGIEAIYEQR